MKSRNGAVWDLSGYFPEFNGPAMLAFKQTLAAEVQELVAAAGRLPALAPENAGQWESLICRAEDIQRRLRHLSSYLDCLTAAHADREDYQTELAVLERQQAEFDRFGIDVRRAVKRCPKAVFEAFVRRPNLADIAHHLRRLRVQARHSMSRKEERLASELNLDGIQAWGRLYDKLTAKLDFAFENRVGRVERRPMSQWRSLMNDPDRRVGRAAFEGGNRAWQSVEDVCAAALNAIAGTRLSLNRGRRVRHPLHWPLFQAGIGRRTLEALYAAVFNRIELAREILRTKARFFGRTGIAFFEREAPLPVTEPADESWNGAVATVQRSFARVYPALARYFARMIEKGWIESQPRPAKRPGAFCSGSPLTDEQRVFMSFNGTAGNTRTLAHEVGHAWHGHLMGGMRPYARRYPMTLAETASIFAEHLLLAGQTADPAVGGRRKFMLLDDELTDAAVFLLDITTRFEFERAFYEERQAGEVPVSRLQALMTQSQQKVFGDALLPDGLDPYFWASKLHFYITDVMFYNFPYTFGYLLARFLLDRFRREGGECFLPCYEQLLKLSGSDTVENLGRRLLGVDFTATGFWRNAIDSLAEPLERYRLEVAAFSSASG